MTYKGHMTWEEAEKYIAHLAETYDINHDGRFDYAGAQSSF